MGKPVPWENPEVNETAELKTAKAEVGLMYQVMRKPQQVEDLLQCMQPSVKGQLFQLLTLT